MAKPSVSVGIEYSHVRDISQVLNEQASSG